MVDLLNLFDELDRGDDEGPFKGIIARHMVLPYPGGKARSLPNILKHLPYRKIYVEPFGGSGAVLLGRRPCTLDVYNDLYSGVVSFYRCLRDPIKYSELINWLELSVHSREDFIDAKSTWETERDDVIRAGKWYYMVNYSFGSLGRNFGRSTSGRGLIAGKIRNKIKLFPYIHQRLQKVQIEHQDFRECIRDYDGRETVFYIDPPYVDAYKGTFLHEMKREDHQELLEMIFQIKGFCAVSGYSNPLYDNQDWDAVHQWESFCSIDSCAYTATNKKEQFKDTHKRVDSTEILWIKEAR